MIELIIDLKLLRDDWEYGVEIFQNDQNIAAEVSIFSIFERNHVSLFL